MNRKIILLPLASFLVLGLGGCGKSIVPATSTEEPASTSSVPASTTSSSSSTVPVADHDDIKDVDCEGAHVIKGVIVGLTETGMLIDDGTAKITTFYAKHQYITTDGYALGDYVKVTETFTKAVNFRYGSYGFSSAAVIAKLDKTKAPTLTETAEAYDGTKLTAWFNSMKAGASGPDGDVITGGLAKRKLVTFDSKIVKSGSYTNWLADGFEYDGGTSVNPADATNKLANWSVDNAEKVYTLTGYLYEVVAQAHCYIWLTGMSDAKANEDLTAATITLPDDGKIAATTTGTATIDSYAPKLAVAPALTDFTWTVTTGDTFASVADGVVTGIAAGAATIHYVHKTVDTIAGDLAVTVTEVPAVAIPAAGLTYTSASINAVTEATVGFNSVTVAASNVYVAASGVPFNAKIGDITAIVGNLGTGSNSAKSAAGLAGDPYTKADLGTDYETMAFRYGVRAIGFTAPFKAASTVTIVCYATYASEDPKYMPTVTIGGTAATITSPTLDTTANTYPGTEFKTVGTKTVYSYTMVYDVSACKDQYMEIVSSASGTTYMGSVVIAAAA